MSDDRPSVGRWLPVVNWGEQYEVSDLGKVRSVDRLVNYSDGRVRLFSGQILTPWLSSGYPYVKLWRGSVGTNKAIHHLVLEAFVGPRPPDCECCHGIGGPGDAGLPNVRWDTPSENALDRVRHGHPSSS